jgi:hypothetical protein
MGIRRIKRKPLTNDFKAYGRDLQEPCGLSSTSTYTFTSSYLIQRCTCSSGKINLLLPATSNQRPIKSCPSITVILHFRAPHSYSHAQPFLYYIQCQTTASHSLNSRIVLYLPLLALHKISTFAKTKLHANMLVSIRLVSFISLELT